MISRLRPHRGAWDMRAFKGHRWLQVRKREAQGYLLNKYRVLLTRAREGLVVWIPPGDPQDPTREPGRLNRTADLLRECGLRPID